MEPSWLLAFVKWSAFQNSFGLAPQKAKACRQRWRSNGRCCGCNGSSHRRQWPYLCFNLFLQIVPTPQSNATSSCVFEQGLISGLSYMSRWGVPYLLEGWGPDSPPIQSSKPALPFCACPHKHPKVDSLDRTNLVIVQE